MEGPIADGFVAAGLDITTTELADELAGGVMSAGPHRLEAAARQGIPQVVCPRGIDMVNFGPLDSIPEKYQQRQLHIHNANVTLMRTTPAECAELGRITAAKLDRARGPVTSACHSGASRPLIFPMSPSIIPKRTGATSTP